MVLNIPTLHIVSSSHLKCLGLMKFSLRKNQKPKGHPNIRNLWYHGKPRYRRLLYTGSALCKCIEALGTRPQIKGPQNLKEKKGKIFVYMDKIRH